MHNVLVDVTAIDEVGNTSTKLIDVIESGNSDSQGYVASQHYFNTYIVGEKAEMKKKAIDVGAVCASYSELYELGAYNDTWEGEMWTSYNGVPYPKKLSTPQSDILEETDLFPMERDPLETKLIGIYEAYKDSNDKLRSLSSKNSLGNVNFTNFKQYSRNRNTGLNFENANDGYRLVTFEMHCMMAWLFYGYYGTTNCQAVCGFGTNAYDKETGLKNSIGMTDTDSTSGNAGSIKFWGLENWWGNKSEWIDNLQTIDGSGGTKLMDLAGNTIESFQFHNTGGGNCITSFTHHNKGFLIVNSVTTNNNYDSYFCDGFWLGGSGCVGFRSGTYANPGGGVGFLSLDYAPSDANALRGSRLAYCGDYYIA